MKLSDAFHHSIMTKKYIMMEASSPKKLEEIVNEVLNWRVNHCLTPFKINGPMVIYNNKFYQPITQ